VERVVYQHPESDFCILRVKLDKGFEAPGEALFQSARTTAVGRWTEPREKERVRLTGRWVEHRTHGLQFEFATVEDLPPSDKAGLVRYLSSSAFQGVGEKLATRIVDKLGEETLERIADEPSALDGIRGLTAAVAERVARTVSERFKSHHVQAYLRGIGLGPLQALSVVEALGESCDTLLAADPYRLAEVPGLGFATADRTAQQQGIVRDDPRRVAAAARHSLDAASNDGHSLQTVRDLSERIHELIGEVPSAAIYQALAALESRDAIACARELEQDELDELGGEDEGARYPDTLRVYLPWHITCERGVATNLQCLLAVGDAEPLADAAKLAKAEAAISIALHETQREAVLTLLSSPVALLTGGPGVGKTTIVQLVVGLAEAHGRKVMLASPTGRAAKRLSEATGREAKTVHRLLGWRPGEGFEHDYDNPLEADIVIVDEVSMLDLLLAHALLKAVQPPTRLIMVGDPDQLPSVGAGNVLADLLRSGDIPTARLTHIFRQAEGSLIVRNAHRVLSGELPQLPEKGDRGADFYWFPAEDPAACAERVEEVVTRRIPETFGLDWVKDVQVIVPMYRGECGVDALNERLRQSRDLGGRELQRGPYAYRVGDRVMQIKNDYERVVFNGDMGFVSNISSDGKLTVEYPEQDVVYSGGDLNELRPAYAITVHRSQGSEFPAVVLPLTTQHHVMLQRNLFYTAMTRARRLVVLVGSQRALSRAVENTQRTLRDSALVERLRRELERNAPPS